ncbi:MAG: GNAT family N-acetyltransferase [Porticoccaceae bacterium]|nr:GNAT family N-acetyltransferase [Porticoccaceae bacterium]
MEPVISLTDKLGQAETLALYRANDWSAAAKPQQLMAALNNSHSLVTARIDHQLVGLGNALSDGHLVVYYPHMLVDPAFHHRGIGRDMMRAMQCRYVGFHQQVLIADGKAIDFYNKAGFERAGKTQAMWVYSGNDH